MDAGGCMFGQSRRDTFRGGGEIRRSADQTPGRSTRVEESADKAFATAIRGAAQQVPYRAEMEGAFGTDFGGVKAHVGDTSAKEGLGDLQARGAARGNEIAFNTASPSRELVAHELTHVVQQNDKVHASSEVSSPSDAAEVEADTVASRVASGGWAGPIGTSSGAIHRDPEPGHEHSTGTDAARSVADNTARAALHEAALREMYFQGERAIAAEAQAMLRAGQSEAAVAQWSVAARNELRRAIREQGEPIVDAVARAARGARDMPTYDGLRASGRTDGQIIASASRSNAGVNRWVGRIRIAGRIMIAIDIGIAVYHVASAPEVDRPRVMASEAGRMGGALAGGWAGGVGGAKLGGLIGTFIEPGGGTAIGAGIGSVLGGIGGAIVGGIAGQAAAEWAIDEFYPPAETRFEQQ
jgi:DNA-binding phage protein